MRYPPLPNSRSCGFDNNLTHPALAAGRKAQAPLIPLLEQDSLYFFRIVKEQPITHFAKPEAKSARAVCLWILVPPARVALERRERLRTLVELDGIEPTTPCLQSRCSPN